MMFRLADPLRVQEFPAGFFRRYGAITTVAAIAMAAFVGMAAVGVDHQRSDAARAAGAAVAEAADKARTIIERQQGELDQLAKLGASAPDAAVQQFLDQFAGFAPGISGAAIADPAGTIELRSAGPGVDPIVLAALAADAAKSADADPGAAMLVTQTIHDGDATIVGLARSWRSADRQVAGIALVALNAAAFPGLDLARADGSPLFTDGGTGGQRLSLTAFPLALNNSPPAKRAVSWPFIAVAGIGAAAVLGLLTMLLRRLGETERELRRRAASERELRDRLADAAETVGRADELSRAKSQFFAQVTHELRTPLNAILGFSETIRQEMFGPVANPRYREYAGLIHDAGSHLLSLINDLLDEARIEAGKMEIAPIRVSAPALARSALDLVELLAEGRDIALATSGLSACPDLNVDPRALKQVLVNLLSNAIKYTMPGGRIDIRFVASNDGGVTIEIADTGIGMSAQDLSLAFEPFGRAGNIESRRQQQGTGLGLSLARALVRLHGGDLTLTSRLGRGTTATVILPASAVFAAAGMPLLAAPAEAA